MRLQRIVHGPKHQQIDLEPCSSEEMHLLRVPRQKYILSRISRNSGLVISPAIARVVIKSVFVATDISIFPRSVSSRLTATTHHTPAETHTTITNSTPARISPDHPPPRRAEMKMNGRNDTTKKITPVCAMRKTAASETMPM